MMGMTRRLEQLLLKQDERRAKLFEELFDDATVDSLKRPADVTEETVSSGVEISAQNSEADARRKRREVEEPPQTVCDSVVSIPLAVPETESGTRQRQQGEPLAKMADRLCDKAGHHYAVCCEHSEGRYRHGNVAHATRFCAPSYGPRRTAVGIG